MYAAYKTGLFFVILLCTSHCLPTNQTDDKPLFKEEDYLDEYYDDNEDDGVYRGLAEENDVKIETTTTRTTKSLSDFFNNVFIDLPKFELMCPENCDCSNENQFINCSGKHLEHMPKNIPETAVRLDLSHNLLNELNEDDFGNFTNLKEIFLNHNQIRTISKEVFSNLKRLDHIDLSGNMLTDIDPDTFINTTELTKLNLSNNAIVLPMDSSFLNHPKLKELYLTNSSITELFDETFRNLTALTSLAINKNDFKQKINTKAFEPLKNLAKLRLPEIGQDNVKELCNVLQSIDVISLKDFDVSCFELVSGTSFDDSIIGSERETGSNRKNSAIEPGVTGNRTTDRQRNRVRAGHGTTMNPPSSLTTLSDVDEDGKIGQQEENNSNDGAENGGKTYQVAVSSQTINYVLIGIIIIAVVGLVIGIVCRRDLCGIKTKLCRTRRPPPTDQVRPAEEIPLNKV